MAERHKGLPLNINSRDVVCEYCHYTERTDKPNPQCPTCKQPMITILYPTKVAYISSDDGEKK